MMKFIICTFWKCPSQIVYRRYHNKLSPITQVTSMKSSTNEYTLYFKILLQNTHRYGVRVMIFLRWNQNRIIGKSCGTEEKRRIFLLGGQPQVGGSRSLLDLCEFDALLLVFLLSVLHTLGGPHFGGTGGEFLEHLGCTWVLVSGVDLVLVGGLLFLQYPDHFFWILLIESQESSLTEDSDRV